MKITLTGSLGYVSTPLTKELIKKGHEVTVISSNAERREDIQTLGAKAMIGSITDVEFLTEAFAGADAVYCILVAHVNFNDPANTVDRLMKQSNQVVHNYLQAIQASNVKRVVYLSSVGAHMSEGNGLIKGHHHAERILGELPDDVAISFMRPVGFLKNLYAFIPAIKNQGTIAANYGGADRTILVANLDIANAIVEELESNDISRTIRYVASEETDCHSAAKALGAAIGLPNLQWLTLTDQQQLHAYISYGMNESLAAEFVQMNASIHTGKFYEDYDLHKPVLGKVKLTDFAPQFAAVYHQQ